MGGDLPLYSSNDQIFSTLFDGTRPYEEQFRYDANGNLSQYLPVDAYGAMEQISQRQQAGRVVQQGNIRYRYDDNGRLVEKNEQRDGFRPQVWRYRWNTQNQLTLCETPDGSRWHYQYDAFGRRIRKLKVHDGKLTATNLQRWLDGKPDLTPRNTTIYGQEYLWSGDQLIEETPIYADGSLALDCRVRWLYEPGALTPSARYERGKLHYVVSDHQGTPREMLNENGTLVWAQRLMTWGKVERSQVIASNDPDYHVNCNLRFAGQYEDEESGLYYNRFRYYNPETAQYISPDPIGLKGGFNPYGYVHNPVGWVDPFGLAGENCAVNLLKNARKNNYAISLEQRQQIIDSIDNTKLKSMFSELYRPGASTPDGGTAASILYTKNTGQLIGGSDHINKGNDYLKALKNLASGDGKYRSEILSSSDRSLANYMIDDLRNALGHL
ncbi:RHS family protein [Xenorhabdus mauleonii]|uniref:RHS family protein n=2 Tax=Xenorhabdus mauleonii TaxID=351675 RepID=A0A2G0NM47_9GAMM|nr:RHS family protein [Xenorhabdus mauleonii]